MIHNIVKLLIALHVIHQETIIIIYADVFHSRVADQATRNY